MTNKQIGLILVILCLNSFICVPIIDEGRYADKEVSLFNLLLGVDDTNCECKRIFTVRSRYDELDELHVLADDAKYERSERTR